MIFFFIVLSILLIFILSLIFAFKSTEPIQHFLSSIDKVKNIRAEYDKLNKNGKKRLVKGLTAVYSEIADSIINMDTRLESSQRTIYQQTQLLQAQMFDKALQRGVYSPEDRASFFSIFKGFPSRFQLAMVRFEPLPDFSFEITVQLQLGIISTIKNHIPGVYIQSLDGNAVVMLLPLDDNSTQWYPELQNLRTELACQSALTLYFSLGDIFNDPKDLVKAWEQLQFINILPTVDDMNTVGRINSIPIERIEMPLSIAMLHMIHNALSSGNLEASLAMLNECADKLPQPEDFLFSELTHNMFSNMILLLKIENPSLLVVSIPEYIRRNQEDLFGTQFAECFKQICGIIKNPKNSSVSKSGRQILDYIDQYIFDPRLYIGMVSNYFSISAPTIQKLVKNMTGSTFLVYVETKRLNRACEMLGEGRFSIREISRACGFSNTNSFYKAFKRFFGFSPSSVMEKHARL
jgi:AraC-like DNA-binding protein